MLEAVHARRYAERMTAYLGLGVQSHVIEVASDDGSLLQHFSRLGIPVIGIEPDHAAAVRAMKVRGIPTLTGSFGRDMALRLAAEGIDADLIVANNALPHMPDLDDFLGGVALLLNPEGVATFEIAPTSDLSRRMAEQLTANDLRVFDIEPTNMPRGPLQLFACRWDSAWQCGPLVARTLAPLH
jgi:2-polyprenyl-3-methyl-5-hydroxy-6-metoxy-1,4-benzoquinol methylase